MHIIIEQPQNDTERWLLTTVEELSRDAGIKMPEVGIFPAQQSNAFATGWNRNDGCAGRRSAGLLNRMRPEEVRAVLAHEIGHVANGDMVTLTLIQGVVNTFVMFFARIAAHAIDAFLKRDDNSGGLGFFGYMAVVFVLELVLGLVASMIVAWFSRWREYRADAAGAKFSRGQRFDDQRAGTPQEHELPDQMPDTMTAFAITTGKSRKLMEQLFASHPPLDDRIAALKAAAYK